MDFSNANGLFSDVGDPPLFPPPPPYLMNQTQFVQNSFFPTAIINSNNIDISNQNTHNHGHSQSLHALSAAAQSSSASFSSYVNNYHDHPTAISGNAMNHYHHQQQLQQQPHYNNAISASINNGETCAFMSTWRNPSGARPALGLSQYFSNPKVPNNIQVNKSQSSPQQFDSVVPSSSSSAHQPATQHALDQPAVSAIATAESSVTSKKISKNDKEVSLPSKYVVSRKPDNPMRFVLRCYHYNSTLKSSEHKEKVEAAKASETVPPQEEPAVKEEQDSFDSEATEPAVDASRASEFYMNVCSSSSPLRKSAHATRLDVPLLPLSTQKQTVATQKDCPNPRKRQLSSNKSTCATTASNESPPPLLNSRASLKSNKMKKLTKTIVTTAGAVPPLSAPAVTTAVSVTPAIAGKVAQIRGPKKTQIIQKKLSVLPECFFPKSTSATTSTTTANKISSSATKLCASSVGQSAQISSHIVNTNAKNTKTSNAAKSKYPSKLAKQSRVAAPSQSPPQRRTPLPSVSLAVATPPPAVVVAPNQSRVSKQPPLISTISLTKLKKFNEEKFADKVKTSFIEETAKQKQEKPALDKSEMPPVKRNKLLSSRSLSASCSSEIPPNCVRDGEGAVYSNKPCAPPTNCNSRPTPVISSNVSMTKTVTTTTMNITNMMSGITTTTSESCLPFATSATPTTSTKYISTNKNRRSGKSNSREKIMLPPVTTSSSSLTTSFINHQHQQQQNSQHSRSQHDDVISEASNDKNSVVVADDNAKKTISNSTNLSHACSNSNGLATTASYLPLRLSSSSSPAVTTKTTTSSSNYYAAPAAVPSSTEAIIASATATTDCNSNAGNASAYLAANNSTHNNTHTKNHNQKCSTVISHPSQILHSQNSKSIICSTSESSRAAPPIIKSACVSSSSTSASSVFPSNCISSSLSNLFIKNGNNEQLFQPNYSQYNKKLNIQEQQQQQQYFIDSQASIERLPSSLYATFPTNQNANPAANCSSISSHLDLNLDDFPPLDLSVAPLNFTVGAATNASVCFPSGQYDTLSVSSSTALSSLSYSSAYVVSSASFATTISTSAFSSSCSTASYSLLSFCKDKDLQNRKDDQQDAKSADLFQQCFQLFPSNTSTAALTAVAFQNYANLSEIIKSQNFLSDRTLSIANRYYVKFCLQQPDAMISLKVHEESDLKEAYRQHSSPIPALIKFAFFSLLYCLALEYKSLAVSTRNSNNSGSSTNNNSNSNNSSGGGGSTKAAPPADHPDEASLCQLYRETSLKLESHLISYLALGSHCPMPPVISSEAGIGMPPSYSEEQQRNSWLWLLRGAFHHCILITKLRTLHFQRPATAGSIVGSAVDSVLFSNNAAASSSNNGTVVVTAAESAAAININKNNIFGSKIVVKKANHTHTTTMNQLSTATSGLANSVGVGGGAVGPASVDSGLGSSGRSTAQYGIFSSSYAKLNENSNSTGSGGSCFANAAASAGTGGAAAGSGGDGGGGGGGAGIGVDGGCVATNASNAAVERKHFLFKHMRRLLEQRTFSHLCYRRIDWRYLKDYDVASNSRFLSTKLQRLYETVVLRQANGAMGVPAANDDLLDAIILLDEIRHCFM